MKHIIYIACVVVVAIIGLGISIPILPFIILHHGGNDFYAGFIFAVFAFFSLIFAPFWGRMADKYGRMRIMLLSLIMTAISYYIISQASELWHIFFARALAGMFSGWMAIAQTMILDLSHNDNRTKNLGIMGAAFGMGYTIGPGVGSIIGQFLMPQDIILLSALCNILAFVLVIILIKPGKKIDNGPNTSSLAIIKDNKLWRYILVYGGSLVAFNAVESTLAVYVANSLHFSYTEVGYLLVLAGMVGIIVQGGFMGILSKHFDNIILIKCGLFSVGVGLFFMVFSENVAFIILAIIFLSMGVSLSSPNLLSFIANKTPVGDRGMVMGMSQSAQSGSRVVGASLFPFLYYHYGTNIAYGVAIAIILCIFIIFKHLTNHTTTHLTTHLTKGDPQ